MFPSLRATLRSLARAPGFSALVVLCLALGIGLNVAFLGIVDLLLFRPPAGVREAATLYRVEAAPKPEPGQRVFIGVQLSRDDVDAIASRHAVFAALTTFAEGGDLSLGRGMEAREIDAALVAGNYFAVLGARPALGRLLGPADDAPGAAPVVVLSDALWRGSYGADRGILGRHVHIGGTDFEVVGVAERGFAGTTLSAPDLWVPLARAQAAGYPKSMAESRDARWLSALGRLTPGTTPARAAQVVTATLAAAAEAAPKSAYGSAAREASLSPVSERFAGTFGGESPVPVWLLGATAAVLLVACANVANLLLARGERRHRELATRSALGANRATIARHLLLESAALAAMGGIAGLVLASFGTRAFALLPSMPPLDDVLNARAALITLGVTTLATLLAGLVPALRGARTDVAAAMKGGTRVSLRRSRLRGVLMVGQFAAALALLAAAGLFVRSLQRVQGVDVGFDLEHTAVVSLDATRLGYTPRQATLLGQRIVERLREVPGVRHAARTAVAPFHGIMFGTVEVPGVELKAMGGHAGMHFMNLVQPEYFAAVGLPLVRGRPFTATDAVPNAPPTVVVNEAFARAAWPTGDAIGQCVKVDGAPCATVIGVARDARFLSLREPPPPLVYKPLTEFTEGHLNVLARIDGDPSAVARSMRAAVQQLDASLPYVAAYPLTESAMLRSSIAPYRLGAAAFSVFGGLSLLVALVGLYAVVSYAVAQRTHEIGIRTALGAARRDVVRLVVGEGLRHAGIGTLVGLALGFAVTRALRAKLYGVAPHDVPTFAVVTVGLLLAAALASWLPARRAAAISPTEALRAE